jgi:hypothetical protein
MKFKLRKLKIFKQTLKKDSVASGSLVYVLDKDFAKIVITHSEILLERYKQLNPQKHWTETQELNMEMGMAGQKAFEMLLQYIGTPYIINDPIVPYTEQKPYDCFIPQVGTVEVKTIPAGDRIKNVIIKEREWHGNDFLIVWQATPNSLALIGWLKKNEVENYPVIRRGDCPQTRYAAARVIPLTALRSPKTFLQMLPTNQDTCSNVELFK